MLSIAAFGKKSPCPDIAPKPDEKRSSGPISHGIENVRPGEHG